MLYSIHLNLSGLRENVVDTLRDRFKASAGTIPVYLHFDTPSQQKVQVLVGEDLFVRPNQELIKDMENILGPDRLSFVLQ